ncbi:PGN_0703 family putative restriction endonuclease [Wenxinia marina]|uniref:Uncharacterized protein n=1 Tax=Wenxinia marina DSM 24838 TaxID=1123501 RepID=A0A0D0QD71_9RHOB|nr:hypothetical protein [Wenxinia marina]KIQ68953.1 hypothetical protein Wenmar_02685 [Wenxinia marina DSM 24838]GGL63802.1 hypothetical protein GCM10011392_18190 [Wenxinia marina]
MTYPADSRLRDGLLDHLPADEIRAAFARSPGNEMASGKFLNPDSSAALAANGFGYFLKRPTDFPAIPGLVDGPVRSVQIEREMRFPWRGGRHPWLDAAIRTDHVLVGVESKRYEPYRPGKSGSFADTYWTHDWPDGSQHYQAVRDAVREGGSGFRQLDVAQLCKHALGLATEAGRLGLRPVLLYLYAEPTAFSDGRPVLPERLSRHRREVADFSHRLAGAEPVFHAMTWDTLLSIWAAKGGAVADHATAVREVFRPARADGAA